MLQKHFYHKLLFAFFIFIGMANPGLFPRNSNSTGSEQTTQQEEANISASLTSNTQTVDIASAGPINFNYPSFILGASILFFFSAPLFFWYQNQQKLDGTSGEISISLQEQESIDVIKEFGATENMTELVKNLIVASNVENHFAFSIESGNLEPALVQLLSQSVTFSKREEASLQSDDEIFLKKVFQIINENINNEQFSLSLLSDSIGISITHFNRKLKKLTGISGGKLIRAIRLNHAANLLSSHSMNIAEVAYEVGFKEPTHFTRSFKRHFGVSPSGYVTKLKSV